MLRTDHNQAHIVSHLFFFNVSYVFLLYIILALTGNLVNLFVACLWNSVPLDIKMENSLFFLKEIGPLGFKSRVI